MIIAHARDDIRDVLKNAGSVTLTDKTPPNLTLADAITLKGIANLDKTTKYNVTDGGTLMAAQAAISGETILSGAASVSINKNFTIADAKAVTGIKTLAKGTVYSIADTADNVLTQSAVAGDKILAGANSVTVVDTSANIIAKLDQLEVLAKAGKIADIKFTDTPISALNITNDQLLKDAEAIGKIISQRTLPTLSVSKPTTPAPLIVVTAPTIQYPDSTLNNTTPTFSGTTSPNTTVNIYENDILLGTTNATSNGNWFIPVTTPLSYGSHTIKAVAIDANGVKSDFAIKSINIVQYTTSIRFPNAQTDNSTPTFSGYTETGSIVKLFENDILLGSTNSTSDGSWYITPTTPLSVGSHTVVAKSFDSTGKQLTTDTKTVTITQSQKPISNLSFVQTTISLGPNGNFPHDVAAADLTGSGYKDIIVGCEFSKNLIIFNNNKDGSFTKGLTLQSDHPLFTPVVADLQKNGSKSIIATGGGVISIFTPQPDGSYIESQVPGASGYRVSSADVNGDGYPDLITSNAVFLNNKNGSFTKSFNFNISGDGNDIKAKDFTGDGLPDVVISNFGQPANFFKNNGDGTFTGPQNLGSNTMDVDFGDLNGDGKLDIVTANQDGTVQIFNNDGNGNFTEGSKINVGSRPGFVIVADINNDGKNDIVVANQGGECLAYVLNDGNGNFSNPINPGNSKFSYGFTVADLNNDGKLDIITANPSDNSISIYKNTGV